MGETRCCSTNSPAAGNRWSLGAWEERVPRAEDAGDARQQTQRLGGEAVCLTLFV